MLIAQFLWLYMYGTESTKFRQNQVVDCDGLGGCIRVK